MTSQAVRRSKVARKVANGRWEIRKSLGEGCFGKVYSAVNTESKQEVAIKFEDMSTGCSQLQHEAEVLKLLRHPVQPQGIAELFYFGKEGSSQMMVMECLGHDLEDSLQACNGTFKVKTTVLIAEQLFRRLEYLHARGVIHQDMKPENCVWGMGERRHHLYLIDFGLSKRYYEHRHVRMRQHSGLVGTARYASINAHMGLEQSRRDDLEAAGHMLLYFLKGKLPWSGLAARSMTEKLKKIQKKKESIPIAELFEGMPREFAQCLTYCRSLGFKERPDYAYLRQLFRGLRERLGEAQGRPLQDHDFEWNAGKVMGDLVPLDLTSSYSQPDDSSFLGRSLASCFCTSKAGANPTVSEPVSQHSRGSGSGKGVQDISSDQKDELNAEAATECNTNPSITKKASLMAAMVGGA